MVFSIRLPEDDRSLILVLMALYILIRLPVLGYLPLVQDEAVYAIMADEQADAPTVVPTLFGYPVAWKPAPFFWVYAGFSEVLSPLHLPLEVTYRLPSFLFGLATVPLIYFILRNAGSSRALAFFTVIIFLFSFTSIYPNAAFLTDSLLFMLVCSSLYLYSDKRLAQWRFIGAAVLAFSAFFVKLVVAFIIPLLALAYIYLYDRKSLPKPVFLLSLMAVPLAWVMHYFLLQGAGLGSEVYVSDVWWHLISPAGIYDQLAMLVGSMTYLLAGSGIWFALSIFGFWKHWRDNLFMSAWYALLVFPVIGAYLMPWYYLPVFPAVSYFAAIVLLKWDGKERTDLFFAVFFTAIIILTVALCMWIYSDLNEDFLPQKEAGLIISGKENVLVIGNWAPGVIAYKMVTEKRESGRPLDFGWVVGDANFTTEMVNTFVDDYYTGRYPVVDGSFNRMYWVKDIFRKDSNVTHFDYMVAIQLHDFQSSAASNLYNSSVIQVLDIR
ncbi:glycosyltransferase family 39 protein [Candidatus Micrarchaeota archaeon]|nr:glycosyltransferase family 39 protein [Candidatus Micrarchaeota archaeon]